MDIHKADLWTVIWFGNLDDFLQKLNIESKSIEEVINSVDKDGISLLQRSLIARRFEIAKFLLENDADVNVISNEKRNELHYLAANINYPGAIDIAYQLVELGVDLNLKDKKYANSALFTLCQDVLTKRTKEGSQFIVKCIEMKPDISGRNKVGYSLKELIEERGTNEMKKAIS